VDFFGYVTNLKDDVSQFYPEQKTPANPTCQPNHKILGNFLIVGSSDTGFYQPSKEIEASVTNITLQKRIVPAPCSQTTEQLNDLVRIAGRAGITCDMCETSHS